ncbi:MAG: hypothetical protein M3548_02510, partial [Actinomycetota bacterium]|nr:hypothetical protein [Actinomycetota bacterium]
PRKPDVVDALPGLPSQQLMQTDVTSEATGPNAPRTTRESTSTQPSASSVAPTASGPTSTGGEPPTAQAGPMASGGSPVQGPTTTRPDVRPSRTTVGKPALIPPIADAAVMGDLTETYYLHVTLDPDAAHAMTTGPMYREGLASIEKRYPDVERVEIKEIVIDPDSATTRSVLRVTHEDGTVTTEERELTFTGGSDPKISGDTAAP